MKSKAALEIVGHAAWRQTIENAHNDHLRRDDSSDLSPEYSRTDAGEIQLLKRAVEHRLGGVAMHVRSAAIREAIDERRVVEEIVHVFELSGHPGAIRAYAWQSSGVYGGPSQVFAVLHAPHTSSPRKAVRAAILTDFAAK